MHWKVTEASILALAILQVKMSRNSQKNDKPDSRTLIWIISNFQCREFVQIITRITTIVLKKLFFITTVAALCLRPPRYKWGFIYYGLWHHNTHRWCVIHNYMNTRTLNTYIEIAGLTSSSLSSSCLGSSISVSWCNVALCQGNTS